MYGAVTHGGNYIRVWQQVGDETKLVHHFTPNAVLREETLTLQVDGFRIWVLEGTPDDSALYLYSYPEKGERTKEEVSSDFTDKGVPPSGVPENVWSAALMDAHFRGCHGVKKCSFCRGW